MDMKKMAITTRAIDIEINSIKALKRFAVSETFIATCLLLCIYTIINVKKIILEYKILIKKIKVLVFILYAFFNDCELQ